MIVRLDYKCHAFISSHRLHGHEQYWYLCVVEGRSVVVSNSYTRIIAPQPVSSLTGQLISTGQANLPNLLKKVLFKHDRQLDLPAFVFSEEGTPGEQKSKMADTDSDESQNMSFCCFYQRQKCKLSVYIYIFHVKEFIFVTTDAQSGVPFEIKIDTCQTLQEKYHYCFCIYI